MTRLIKRLADYGDVANTKYLRLSVNPENGLTTVKYSKAAFYDQAWKQYPILCQARGHTFDTKTGEIVTRPLDKVFNYNENGAGLDIPDDHMLTCMVKVNGFMGAATLLKSGEVILQTAGGTVSNDFLMMFEELFTHDVEEHFRKHASFGVTHMFEVVHPKDPHIVPEEPGLYLLAMRGVEEGIYTLQQYVDVHAKKLRFKRPLHVTLRKKTLLDQVRHDNSEGWMVLDQDKNVYVFKLKTPHYLARKFLARVKKDSYKVDDPRHDEEVRAILKTIQAHRNIDSFFDLTDTERIAFIDQHHEKLFVHETLQGSPV